MNRSPRRGMCAAILSLEAITLGLSTPVLLTLTDVSVPVGLAVGLGPAVFALLLAGALRSEGAYRAGWVLQGIAISLGVLVPMMFFLGAVFGLLWGTADLLGRKIDRERAAAYAALEDSSDPDPDAATDPAYQYAGSAGQVTRGRRRRAGPGPGRAPRRCSHRSRRPGR